MENCTVGICYAKANMAMCDQQCSFPPYRTPFYIAGFNDLRDFSVDSVESGDSSVERIESQY
jgi:hypothetical protein